MNGFFSLAGGRFGCWFGGGRILFKEKLVFVGFCQHEPSTGRFARLGMDEDGTMGDRYAMQGFGE